MTHQFSLLPGLKYPLPPLMLDANGRTITSAADWKNHRKLLLERFQTEMYGPLPLKPNGMKFEILDEFDDAFGGIASCRLVRISFMDDAAPKIDLILYLPNKRRKVVPVFLVLGFCGNQTLTDDPRIPERMGWNPDNCKVRGSVAKDWMIERTLMRGYALAHFCNNDVDEDRLDPSVGIRAWEDIQINRTLRTADRGSIGSWAWGIHRCVDYLLTDAAFEAKRIAVMGHSRNGKAALLAGAMDERIGLVISHQSGCGGAAPSRGDSGEQTLDINTRFPHWFNKKFKTYSDAPKSMPLDQHQLIACVAPRPILLSNAVGDAWANPTGQFSCLQAAAPAWTVLGKTDLDVQTQVVAGRLTQGRLGTYLRQGKHAITADDWAAFLDYCDRWIK